MAILSPAWSAESAKPKPLVQIAILLDTSGSMEGLISQARARLWEIVNEFAVARRDGQTPELQVALYEYGNIGLPREQGYIRLVAPLTTDLDKVSEDLFALRTNGGDEYCGQVIQAAVDALAWSGSNQDYKAIFIAGNEPFTQGAVDYRQSCRAAIRKGIVVNTIHCGSLEAGITGQWKDGALLADGQYAHIDQNQAIAHVAAPQDAEIARLSAELNSTYIPFGAAGVASQQRQAEQDANAARMNPSAFAGRASAKSSVQYRNSNWDLVDAVRDGKVKAEAVRKEDLPKELQGLSPEQLAARVAENHKRRAEINKQIQSLTTQRARFVAEQEKKARPTTRNSLDAAMLQAIRSQATARNFEFIERVP